MGGSKDKEARLRGAQRKDNRKWPQMEIQEIAFKPKKKTQATQRVRGGSPSLETLKINWTQTWATGSTVSRGPCQPQPLSDSSKSP